ncbi:Phage-related minor tail protein-like [Rhodobacterales bacterium HTCC2150]|nr:Phage-related minor tail protein-like [Rhodobacterales bacterium HTCC2150] [Rhodobacteraceae bacterium HTCC2150]
MADIESLEDLDDQIEALEVSIGGAAALAAAFNGELLAMRETMTFTNREISSLSTSIGGGLRRAFDGLVFDGLRASDALRMVATSIIDNVYNVAMRPIQNAAGGLIANSINGLASAILPFANGAGFTQGRVMPFAQGGVISGAMNFPMRGGKMGLMGEAGPEAIMPLTRGADGRLGVQAQGGSRAVNVVMNITTPDVAGFQRSQSQIAAQASRALARGQRNR